MKKAKSKSIGLEALNDFYIIKEDPIEPTVDKASGLTKEVVDAIKSSKLYIPETAEYALDKFPCRGVVVSKGPDSRFSQVKVGMKVSFARLGGMRWNLDGEPYMTISEKDVHALIVEC